MKKIAVMVVLFIMLNLKSTLSSSVPQIGKITYNYDATNKKWETLYAGMPSPYSVPIRNNKFTEPMKIYSYNIGFQFSSDKPLTFLAFIRKSGTIKPYPIHKSSQTRSRKTIIYELVIKQNTDPASTVDLIIQDATLNQVVECLSTSTTKRIRHHINGYGSTDCYYRTLNETEKWKNRLSEVDKTRVEFLLDGGVLSSPNQEEQNITVFYDNRSGDLRVWATDGKGENINVIIFKNTPLGNKNALTQIQKLHPNRVQCKDSLFMSPSEYTSVTMASTGGTAFLIIIDTDQGLRVIPVAYGYDPAEEGLINFYPDFSKLKDFAFLVSLGQDAEIVSVMDCHDDSAFLDNSLNSEVEFSSRVAENILSSQAVDKYGAYAPCIRTDIIMAVTEPGNVTISNSLMTPNGKVYKQSIDIKVEPPPNITVIGAGEDQTDIIIPNISNSGVVKLLDVTVSDPNAKVELDCKSEDEIIPTLEKKSETEYSIFIKNVSTSALLSHCVLTVKNQGGEVTRPFKFTKDEQELSASDDDGLPLYIVIIILVIFAVIIAILWKVPHTNRYIMRCLTRARNLV